MIKLKNRWNNMCSVIRDLHNKGSDCDCDVCSNSTSGASSWHCLIDLTHFKGLVDMQTFVLSPMEQNGWYKLECLMVNCTQKSSNTREKLVKWRCYQKVITGFTKKEKLYFMLHLQYKQTTANNFLNCMQPRIKQFIIHNFISKWQEEQHWICLATIPSASIVLVIDFVENYSFIEFNEIQEMHWMSIQFMVLVHICYLQDEDYLKDPDLGAQKTITKYTTSTTWIMTYFFFSIVFSCIERGWQSGAFFKTTHCLERRMYNAI